MTKEELKPIDTSKYKITETGQVLKMTKDEMKNKISMALKDSVLQQCFEIICKENAELRGKTVKWHRISDGDYPPCEKSSYTINVLTDCGDIAYYDYNLDCWIVEPSSAEIDPPIAWCEIPKFEE